MARDEKPRPEPPNSENTEGRFGDSRFPYTSMTEIVNARGDGELATEALASLCKKYWYPLYAFLRRRGHGEEDAKDLTQGFFSSFLASNSFEGFDPARGRLRSYLLGALKHYEANWKRHKQTIRAGGEYQFVSLEWMQAEDRYQAEPRDIDAPDRLYDRRWALMMLEGVRDMLREQYFSRDRGDLFEALVPFLDGKPPGESAKQAAERLGMTEAAFKTALSRMRGQRRNLLRAQIALTVASEELVDEEIGFLLSLFESSAARPKPGN